MTREQFESQWNWIRFRHMQCWSLDLDASFRILLEPVTSDPWKGGFVVRLLEGRNRKEVLRDLYSGYDATDAAEQSLRDTAAYIRKKAAMFEAGMAHVTHAINLAHVRGERFPCRDDLAKLEGGSKP